jgi:hypothetical protein
VQITDSAMARASARSPRIRIRIGRRRVALACGLVSLAVVASPALAQNARERAKAAAAAEAARTKALTDKGLPPLVAACHAKIERQVLRHRSWEAFRSAESAEAVKEGRAIGKFSPRFPVDVETVQKFPGELRKKRKTQDEEESWVPAEAWCGLTADKLVAADVFGPGEKR